MKLLPASMLAATIILAPGCSVVTPEKVLRTVRLDWDKETGVIGYNVYVNDGTSYRLRGLTSTNTFTLALTPGNYSAYVTALMNDLESAPSNVVSFKVKGNPNDK